MQHYIGIYENAGFSILLLIFPWMLLRVINKIRYTFKINAVILSVVPLLLYHLYAMFIHGISLSKILYNGYMILFIILVVLKCINVSIVVKTAITVCSLASIALVAQYFCYYILGFHLQLVPTDLLLEESSSWILGAKTGLYNIRGGYNGFYRPSAFFLEPSHFSLYSIPCLCMLLLSHSPEKKRIKKAALLTVGLVLSTSGLGIVICIFIWGIYILFYEGKSANSKKIMLTPNKMFLIIGFLALLLVLYLTVDTIRNTVNRIFIEEGKSSAIGGRTNQALLLVKKLSGKAIIFGLTDDASNISFNMPGFFATMYKKGLIGIVLSYAFYCGSMFKTKGRYFWLSTLLVLLSFFTAHTHGTFFMLYFMMFLIGGYDERDREKALER